MCSVFEMFAVCLCRDKFDCCQLFHVSVVSVSPGTLSCTTLQRLTRPFLLSPHADRHAGIHRLLFLSLFVRKIFVTDISA